MTAVHFHCTGNELQNSSADQKISPEAPLTNVENPIFKNVHFRRACPLRMTKLYHLRASKKQNKTKLNAQQFLLIQPLAVQVKPVLSSQEIRVETRTSCTCARTGQYSSERFFFFSTLVTKSSLTKFLCRHMLLL